MVTEFPLIQAAFKHIVPICTALNITHPYAETNYTCPDFATYLAGVTNTSTSTVEVDANSTSSASSSPATGSASSASSSGAASPSSGVVDTSKTSGAANKRMRLVTLSGLLMGPIGMLAMVI